MCFYVNNIFNIAEFAGDGYTRVLPAPTITNSAPTGKINYSDNIFLEKSIITRYTGELFICSLLIVLCVDIGMVFNYIGCHAPP